MERKRGRVGPRALAKWLHTYKQPPGLQEVQAGRLGVKAQLLLSETLPPKKKQAGRQYFVC